MKWTFNDNEIQWKKNAMDLILQLEMKTNAVDYNKNMQYS